MTPMRAESLIALTGGIAGAALFTTLVLLGRISEVTYVGLLSLVVITALALHGFNRIKELDLRNLKMTLSRIESARTEVEVRHSQLQDVAVRLLEVVAFHAAWSNRRVPREVIDLQRRWLQERAEELLGAIDAGSQTRDRLLWYQEAFQQLDAVGDDDSLARQQILQTLYSRMALDLGDFSTPQIHDPSMDTGVGIQLDPPDRP